MSVLPVQFTVFSTTIGACGIAWRGNTVIATRLPHACLGDTARHFVERWGATESSPPSVIRDGIGAIRSLLEGGQTDLSGISCDLGDVTPFAAQVYVATRAIPAGETRTYGAIASQIGEPRRAREVGHALGRNPLPIIVPCHRVLGAKGKLVGFSAPGGVHTKLRMLAIENARLDDAPGLFDDLPLTTKPPR